MAASSLRLDLLGRVQPCELWTGRFRGERIAFHPGKQQTLQDP